MRLVYLFLVLLATLSANPAGAQSQPKADWKDNVVLRDGQPYARLLKQRGGIFSLRPLLSEVEILLARPMNRSLESTDEVYYEVSFVGSGQKFQFQPRALNPGRNLAQLIVDNELLTADGQLNPAGERRLLLTETEVYAGRSAVPAGQPNPAAYATPTSTGAPTRGSGSLPAEVRPGAGRAPIVVAGNRLLLLGREIGTLRQRQVAEAGELLTVVEFFRVSEPATPVAEATYEQIQPETVTVRTTDHRRHTVPLLTDLDAPSVPAQVARFLLEHSYL